MLSYDVFTFINHFLLITAFLNVNNWCFEPELVVLNNWCVPELVALKELNLKLYKT